MIFSLVLGSILFAGWRSRHTSLLWYFLAQLAYALVVLPLSLATGATGVLYATTYAFLTALILFSVVWLVLEAVREKRGFWYGAVVMGLVALAVGRYAFVNLGRASHYYDYIGVIEGSMLLWAGFVLAGLARYLPRWDIALTLGILWTCQAVFRIGFYLDLPDSHWLALNWRIPPALCVVAFTVVGCLCSKRRSA